MCERNLLKLFSPRRRIRKKSISGSGLFQSLEKTGYMVLHEALTRYKKKHTRDGDQKAMKGEK